MSPRAAWRLEALGFASVYDYVAGKADWLAAGLPSDGQHARRARAGGVADPDVPTCRLDEPLRDVACRLRDAGTDTAIVIDSKRVVLGRLRLGRFPEDSREPVASSMEEGPTTVRASESLEDLLERMRARNTRQIIVTTPDGGLLGLLRDPHRKLS